MTEQDKFAVTEGGGIKLAAAQAKRERKAQKKQATKYAAQNATERGAELRNIWNTNKSNQRQGII